MTEKTMEKTTNEVKKIDDNLIYVGHKPPMNYDLAVVTQFNGNGTKDVILKIRGRSISTAVDTSEIVRNRFVKNAKAKDITISTKSFEYEDGKKQMFHQLKYVLQRLRKPEGKHNVI
jgi:DNA-binding protein